MKESPRNVETRITRLERSLISINEELNAQVAVQQELQEQSSARTEYGNQNLLRNGDFDQDRNTYLYTTDYSGPNTPSADVSEECAHWYTAEADPAVESTGDITSSDQTLTLDTSDFISGDAGEEIVVEGAGASGADLVTTINTYTSATEVELTDAASTTVTGARVRWRMQALTEDSTDEDEDATATTNSALKTSNHTRYSDSGIINNPDYDKDNGWVRVSTTNRLCAPFPKNLIKPSKSYYISFIYRISGQVGGEDSIIPKFEMGLWDNSSGRREYMSGKEIDITATVVGSPAGTVSRDYFIVFYTRWGETIGSKVVTVANAPNDASFVTNSIYVDLSWTPPPSTVKTEIYRKTGSTYHLIKLPYPQISTRDDGATIKTIGSSFPSTTYVRGQARLKTTDTNISPAKTSNWERFAGRVTVPEDYDVSGTTDKQWFVLGLQEAITGSGSERALEIDLVSVDTKFGLYSLSPLDLNSARDLSSAPSEGSQGGAGTGDTGGGGDIGEGGTLCPCFDQPIYVEDKSGLRSYVPAIDLVNRFDLKIINRQDEPVRYQAQVSPMRKVIYEIITEGGGTMRASLEQPVFENERDLTGKPLKDLRSGDTILRKDGSLDVVLTNIRKVQKEYVVPISIVEGEEHGYWIKDWGVSNLKPEDPIDE